MLLYLMAIWSIFLLFGIFYGTLVHFVVIWFIFPGFGILYPEKSANHGVHDELWRLNFQL
jgi:hypothetical protein